MKTIATLLLTLILSTAYGQNSDYKILLDSAKALFKEEADGSKENLGELYYDEAAALLKKAIRRNPDSAEAHYFLGYAYSRINSRDGQGMLGMNLDLLYRTSEQFEKVIALSPKYAGQIIVLDPYSKISSEWGSMAMSYLYKNERDSAVWAFKEGKKRGGFGSYLLEVNKKVLDACSKNAVLISSGDNFTFPLWYLQIVEHYRTDVSAVDISLLGTNWYPRFLSQNNAVSFDLPLEVLDTMDYINWEAQKVTIGNFSWEVESSIYDHYLLRGDRVFMSLLKANKFQRDLFFTIGFEEKSRLGLGKYLRSYVVADKLVVLGKSDLTFKEYKTATESVLKLSPQLNLNSPDQFGVLDNIRYQIVVKINNLRALGENAKASELMTLMNLLSSQKKYPYQTEGAK